MFRYGCLTVLATFLLISCTSTPPAATPEALATPIRTAENTTVPIIPTSAPTIAPTNPPDNAQPDELPDLTEVIIDPTIKLENTFQSTTGRLRLNYPDEWTITQVSRSVYPVERIFRLTNTSNPRFIGESGQIQITIYDPVDVIESIRRATTADIPLETLLKTWRADVPTDVPYEIVSTKQARFADRAFIQQDARTANTDIRSYFIRNADGTVVRVEVVTPVGEMATAANTLDAIAATVEYPAPQAPKPGTPAFVVQEAFATMQRGESAEEYTCIQDAIGGALLNEVFKLSEGILDEIAQMAQSQVQKGDITLNFADLFFEDVYEEPGQAIVAVGGTATLNDGTTTIAIPFSRVFGLNGAVRALAQTGKTWQLCQSLMLTGFNRLRAAERERQEARGIPEDPQIYWLDEEKDVISRITIYGTQLQRFTRIGTPLWFVLDSSAQQLYLIKRKENTRLLTRVDLATMESTVIACSRPDPDCPATELPDDLSTPTVDTANRMFYWTTGSGVMRADFDLQEQAQIVSFDTWYAPLEVALDTQGQKLYIATLLPFADTKNKQITAFYRSNLDGSNLEQLGTTPGIVTKISYSDDGLFFTLQLAPTISRFNPATGEVTVFAEARKPIPAMTVVSEQGKIYWVELNKLFRADLDGKNVELVYSALVAFNFTDYIQIDMAPR